MDEINLAEQVKAIVAEISCKEVGDVSARLFDDLNMDDLDVIELALEIELQFERNINDDALVKLVTVNDVIELVKSIQ